MRGAGCTPMATPVRWCHHGLVLRFNVLATLPAAVLCLCTFACAPVRFLGTQQPCDHVHEHTTTFSPWYDLTGDSEDEEAATPKPAGAWGKPR